MRVFGRHSASKAKGWFLDESGNPTSDTLQCIHCQAHWQFVPGSGRKRGYCMNCGGPTCGKKDCETNCEHWEKKLERIEKGG